MKPKISIITLGVVDVSKSTDFYRRLGFPISSEGEITFIKMPSIWLALYGVIDLAKDVGVSPDRTGFSGFTLAHNVASKEQVDRVILEAEGIGANVTDQPHDRDWGGYSGYFQDIDGYFWEVAYNPYSPEIAVIEDVEEQ